MADAQFHHGHALLIGVGADLPVTVKDATALRDLLVDPRRAAYPPDQVELLTESSARRADILAAFDRLLARISPASGAATVIVYYSGHGGYLPQADGTKAYFLLPYGYDPTDRPNTAIFGGEFTARIEALQQKARKLIVLLDCCHAAGVPEVKDAAPEFVPSHAPPELTRVLDRGSGLVVIASSQEQEKSYVGDLYSVFTACLLEALEGKGARKPDGYARILDVMEYLFEQVPKRAPGPQHPFLNKAYGVGENFPLCYYAPPPPIPAPPPPQAPLSGVRRRHLEQRMRELRASYDTHAQIAQELRAALDIETDVLTGFKYQEQLQKKEREIEELVEEMEGIEQALKQPPADPGAPVLTVSAPSTESESELRIKIERWRKELQSATNPSAQCLLEARIQETEKKLATPPIPPRSANVLIVTATEVEGRTVRDLFQEKTGSPSISETIDDRVYRKLGELHGACVWMTMSEMGSGGRGGSQETVRKGVEALRPSAVILTGIAFGVHEQKQKIGDILVSTQLWPYELQRVGADKLIPRADKPHASPRLISFFRNAALDWKKATVHFGLILTGEKVVDDLDYRESLKQFESEAIGGEMEGAGLYVSCEDVKVDWIVVKAICDWADGRKAQDKEERQQLAARNAVEFVLHALQHAPLIPASR